MREYFGDWLEVMDIKELVRLSSWLSSQNPAILCPSHNDVFRAFTLCSLDSCRVVFLGQDPYPQKEVATGILFGNRKSTPEGKISPSLEVIKEASVDYGVPHQELDFDITLESWAGQGILMINSSLTCDLNKVGSHVLQWRRFMAYFLEKLSRRKSNMVYVLFGRQARSFKGYIDAESNLIIETEHPAWFARTGNKMPGSVFTDINRFLESRNYQRILWYKEYKPNKEDYEKEFLGNDLTGSCTP